MDTRTPDQRRRIMQAVRQKNTGPELAVRRALHRLGFRYRIHPSTLPGRPDLVFPSRKKIVFVHGCFWHGHGCAKGRLPTSRLEYWAPKVQSNKERDRKTVQDLERLGWKCMVVWQCEIKMLEVAVQKVINFLGPATNSVGEAGGPEKCAL